MRISLGLKRATGFPTAPFKGSLVLVSSSFDGHAARDDVKAATCREFFKACHSISSSRQDRGESTSLYLHKQTRVQ